MFVAVRWGVRPMVFTTVRDIIRGQPPPNRRPDGLVVHLALVVPLFQIPSDREAPVT